MSNELDQILSILENLEDQQYATELLMQFNRLTKAHHVLILNQDPDLDHEKWKLKCDQSKKELDQIIDKILSL